MAVTHSGRNAAGRSSRVRRCPAGREGACGADARIDQCNSLLRSSISGSATSPPTRAESWTPWREAERAGATLVVTPELSLCGYPPEDLLLRPAFIDACAGELAALAGTVTRSTVLVGFPERAGSRCHNAVAVVRDGRVAQVYRKSNLPNYTVFDEERYFEPGRDPCVFDVDGVRFGVILCEDVWFPEPAARAKTAGAQVLLVPNGSPYHTRQHGLRRAQVDARTRETGLPVVYVNRVGGQDELVFDGASFVVDATGALAQQVPAWHETVALAHFDGPVPRHVRGALDAALEPHVYDALVMGVRDYVGKNRFPGVLLGLSGGVDSALTLAVAVDALGPERVRAVMLPSQYNAPISLADAREMAGLVGVRYDEIPIGPVFSAFLATLAPEFRDLPPDTTEENIQARIRGTLLMALSNKYGSIVLTTGNKSEMAVGYATLYGDMAGGFAVIKDIPKTLVYRLCHYRNRLGRVIPERIITRAAVGGAAAGSARRRLAAAVRGPRRHPRSLRRAGPEPGARSSRRAFRRTRWPRSSG